MSEHIRPSVIGLIHGPCRRGRRVARIVIDGASAITATATDRRGREQPNRSTRATADRIASDLLASAAARRRRARPAGQGGVGVRPCEMPLAVCSWRTTCACVSPSLGYVRWVRAGGPDPTSSWLLLLGTGFSRYWQWF
jgi:hypothetical protein